MRTLNVTFDNEEFEQIEKLKDSLHLSWREFIIKSYEKIRKEVE